MKGMRFLREVRIEDKRLISREQAQWKENESKKGVERKKERRTERKGRTKEGRRKKVGENRYIDIEKRN